MYTLKIRRKNMNIIDNSKSRTFDKLAVGDVFTVNNYTGYYMRIAIHMDSNDRIVNAISLEYGSSFCFSNETMIKKVDATLVIGTVPVVTNQVVTKEKSETKEENEIEKLKKMTLEEIAKCCHNTEHTPCKNCPIYPECTNTVDVIETFENLHTLFNK